MQTFRVNHNVRRDTCLVVCNANHGQRILNHIIDIPLRSKTAGHIDFLILRGPLECKRLTGRYRLVGCNDLALLGTDDRWAVVDVDLSLCALIIVCQCRW